MNQLLIRRATCEDVEEITLLFRTTILIINVRDYNADQVKAWSAVAEDTEMWLQRIAKQYFLVACTSGQITGFASLADDGYLDMMYVHHAFQRRGIAQRLLQALEARAGEKQMRTLYTHASITARRFFEKNGFEVEGVQERTRAGIVLITFSMRRQLDN